MIDRRTFLFAAAAAACGRRAMGQPSTRLETLSDWLQAAPESRKLALPATLDRIRSMDASIHAWVQVAPQPPTGAGPLAEIPFGVKDIIETKGLSTEYGSPIYKGRIGIADAAVFAKNGGTITNNEGGIITGVVHGIQGETGLLTVTNNESITGSNFDGITTTGQLSLTNNYALFGDGEVVHDAEDVFAL